LLNGGFEGGTLGWAASTGVIVRDAARARTGARYARLGARGRTGTTVLSQTLRVPADGRLRVWMAVATEERAAARTLRAAVRARNRRAAARLRQTAVRDTLRLDVQSGPSATTLRTWSNADRSGWVSHTVDLSAYAGERVTLRFVAREDGARATTFRLDDLGVTGG
jgi:hypothetical protein